MSGRRRALTVPAPRRIHGHDRTLADWYPMALTQWVPAEPDIDPGHHLKPVLLGFQSMHGNPSPAMLRTGRRLLAGFADLEGFALSDVFLIGGSTAPASALHAVIDAATRTEAAAIAVPSGADLGRTPREQAWMRDLIQAKSALPVHIVHDGAMPKPR